MTHSSGTARGVLRLPLLWRVADVTSGRPILSAWVWRRVVTRFPTARHFGLVGHRSEGLRISIHRVRSICRWCANRRDSQSANSGRVEQQQRTIGASSTHSLRCAWLLACLPGVYRLLQVNSVSTAYTGGHYRKAEKPIAIGRRSSVSRPRWHIDRFNRVGAGWVASAKTGAGFAKQWRRPRWRRLRRYSLQRTLRPRGCEICSYRRRRTNARAVRIASTRWKRSARWTRWSSTSSASSAEHAVSISR